MIGPPSKATRDGPHWGQMLSRVSAAPSSNEIR